jgi:hypothetical protein
MSLIVGLEHQPAFPHEDLTEDNADMLELLLQNLEFVENGHQRTEEVSWAYKVEHPAVMKVSKVAYQSTDSQRAIDHGIKIFESIVSMVSTPPDHLAILAAERAYAGLILGKDTEDLRNYSMNTVNEMREQFPITSETVRLAARRQCGRLTEYALLGAAMSRQFGVDCVSR